MKKLLLKSLLSGIAMLSINTAFAATATTNFQATSTLASTCVLSASDMNFGTLDFVTNSANVYADGNISLLCSKGVTYSLTPASGFGNGLQQNMKGTGTNKDAIEVRLFKGDGVTSWTSVTTGPITGSGTGANVIVPIKALTSPGYNPKSNDATVTNTNNSTAQPDSYSATVTVKVTY